MERWNAQYSFRLVRLLHRDPKRTESKTVLEGWSGQGSEGSAGLMGGRRGQTARNSFVTPDP